MRPQDGSSPGGRKDGPESDAGNMGGAARFGANGGFSFRRLVSQNHGETFRGEGQLSAGGSARRKDGRLGACKQDRSDSVESREDGLEGRQGQGKTPGRGSDLGLRARGGRQSHRERAQMLWVREPGGAVTMRAVQGA